jgi:DNA-directed RNA polymerase subunit RPC12/RpoP
VATRIAIDCLKCGHCTSVSVDKLPAFGLEPETSLVTLTKRLVCKECGSRTVQAFRYIEDSMGPPLVPEA